MECIFCQIATRQAAADIVYESATVMGFKDAKPKSPVHLLFIPKIHIPSVADLEPQHSSLVADMVYAAKDTAIRLKLEGYKLVCSVGRAGGQMIDHVHLHLLSGWRTGSDRPSVYDI